MRKVELTTFKSGGEGQFGRLKMIYKDHVDSRRY